MDVREYPVRDSGLGDSFPIQKQLELFTKCRQEYSVERDVVH